MKNLLFLMALLPSVIAAQSAGADRMFVKACLSSEYSIFNNGRYCKQDRMEEGNYVSDFSIRSYNSAKRDYVSCDISLYYTVKENEIEVTNVQKGETDGELTCAEGFNISSVKVSNKEENVIVAITWTYTSPEKTLDTYYLSAKERGYNPSDDYNYVPVNSENTLLNRKSIVKFSIYDGVQVQQSGGTLNPFSASGIYLTNNRIAD